MPVVLKIFLVSQDNDDGNDATNEKIQLQEAVATMDHKTFELSRYLGYLNYQAQKLKKTLKSKQQALEDLEKEVKGNEED